MRYCPFCSRSVGNDPHIYSCKSKTTSDKKEIKFLFIKRNFPEICNIDELLNCYVVNLNSLVDIRKKYLIDFKSILFLLDYFNIKKRSISESAKKISTHKYKKTCLEKYGFDNVSKSNIIKDMKKNTFLNNYGVDNIFKDSDFKKWILENNFAWNNLTDDENRLRVEKQTASIKKYWSKLTDEQKNKLYSYNGTSKLETAISSVLNDLCISYTTQFPLCGKLFDFRITNTNLLIEVNGDYWHCNPLKFKQDEYVKFPGGNKKVSDIWNKDLIKRNKAIESGYNVIYIWEKEIKDSVDIKKLVMEKLNLNQLF